MSSSWACDIACASTLAWAMLQLAGCAPMPSPSPRLMASPPRGGVLARSEADGERTTGQLSLGDGHSCYLFADGALSCWGSNGSGELGDGTKIDRFWPTVSSMRGARLVAAGCGTTCAVVGDREVTCWGDGCEGKALESRHLPDRVEQVALGLAHACARTATGAVYCWGDNQVSQLGVAETVPSRGLVRIAGIQGVHSLAVGARHSCVALEDGSVWCWGRNDEGQSGRGPVALAAPTKVLGVQDAVEVGAGWDHSCARTRQGQVFCWGDQHIGPHCKHNETHHDPGTAYLRFDRNAQSLGVGASSACVLDTEARVWCWGANKGGQLGTGQVDPWSPTEYPHSATLEGVADLVVGRNHACARRNDGALLCWGANLRGALGNGSASYRPRPVVVQGLPRSTRIAAGLDSTCAGAPDGSALCWGALAHGSAASLVQPWRALADQPIADIELGNSAACAAGARSVSCLQPGSPGETVTAVPDVVQVAAGARHVCVRKRDGSVGCWGDNAAGQLGDFYGARTAFVPLTNLREVEQLGAQGEETCARKRDGTIWCWGGSMRGDGQRGQDTRKPAPMMGIGDAVVLRAAQGRMCALRERDGIVCWRDRTKLESVPGTDGAADFTLGRDFGCILRRDATIACWGNNDVGQAGDGTTTHVATPTVISGLDNVTAIVSGYQHVCALRRDGTVMCWGGDEDGQVGERSDALSPVPVPVRW